MSRSLHLSRLPTIAGPSRIPFRSSPLPPIKPILRSTCPCRRQFQSRSLFTRRGTSFWTQSYPSAEAPQVPYTPPPPDQLAGRNEEVDGQRRDRKQRYLDSLMDKAGELSLRCSVLDAEGNWTAEEGKYKKSELCREHDLDPRDLRKLDSLAPNLVPIILTRRTCIIISMLHIKVLIKPDRVIVFDNNEIHQESETQRRFKYHLERNIKAGLGIPQSAEMESGGKDCEEAVLCYEHRALESVLVASANALEEEMAFTRHLVQHLLSDLESDINRENLKRLLHYSRKIVGFQSRARYVKRAVDEVLESDEDLSAMYLTSRAQGRPRALHDHEQLELLLESFVKQVEEIVSEVDTTVANMNSTQEIAELMLDSGRNALLALDVKISIATLGIGTGALIAGLFGMNLTSTLESTPYAFLVVSGTASFIALLVMIYGTKTLRRVRRVALSDGRSRTDELAILMNSKRWDRSVEQFSKGYDPFLVDNHKKQLLWDRILSKNWKMRVLNSSFASTKRAQAQAQAQAQMQAAKQARAPNRQNVSSSTGNALWHPEMENGVWKGFGHTRRWAKE